MLCQQCQTPLNEGELHCPTCGAPVPPPVSDKPEVNAAQAPFTPPYEAAQEPAFGEEPEGAVTVKKPKPIGWIVTAAIAAVVIAAAVVLLFVFNKAGGSVLDGMWKASVRLDGLTELAEKTGAFENEALLAMYQDVDIEAMFEMFEVEEPLTLYADFHGNECDLYLNTNELTDFLDKFYDNVIVYIENGGYYDIMAFQGYSREEVDEMLAQQGLTMDTLTLALAMSKGQIVNSLETELATLGIEADDAGNMLIVTLPYSYENGKLSFAAPGGEVDPRTGVGVTVNGDRLEFAGMNADDAALLEEMLVIERGELPK